MNLRKLHVPCVFFIGYCMTAQLLAQTEKKTMVALGDSISVGFNAKRLGDNMQYSWTTGKLKTLIRKGFDPMVLQELLRGEWGDDIVNFASIHERLQENFPNQYMAFNYAVAGAEASEVEMYQLPRLERKKPEAVTLMIGANDVCIWPDEYESSNQEFHNSLDHIIDRTIKANNNVKILMVTIPNLPWLYELGAPDDSCRMRWNVSRMCLRLLSYDTTEEQRLKFIERFNIANETIANVAKKYPKHVALETGAQDYQFTRDDVSSIDCFHPSLRGQALLADKSWEKFKVLFDQKN